MSTSHPQKPFQEILDVFKQGYETPTKVILWAKALREWGHFFVGGFILLCIIFLLVFSGLGNKPNTSGFPQDQRVLISNFQNIVKFMNLVQMSVNERQELHANLMNMVAAYAGDKPEQHNLQSKIETLTSIFNICDTTRRIYLRRFSNLSNPLTDVEVASAYAAMLDTSSDDSKPPITAQSEREQWNLLCKLCAHEMQKAENEFSELLAVQ